ncbi:MAG TPA: porin [Phycisphaerales bacterium]|nr:porin [Phycisphaerales bacterium]
MRPPLSYAPLGIMIAAAAAPPLAAQGHPGAALERELLADAGARASFQGAGPTGGHDGRFFLGSADGNFRLTVSGEVQFRYYGNIDADTEGSDEYVGGFQHNRVRLDFRGHVIDPRLTYRVQSNFDREDGTMELQDAWGNYAFENGLSLQWGQFKLLFDREFAATSATNFLTIEQSLVSSIFRLDRSQGVQLSYEGDRFRVAGALSDGRRASNTASFDDEVEADIALSGRAEVRLGGAAWKQFRDQTSFRGDRGGALLGVGGHWQQEGATGAPSASADDADLFSYTADAGYEGGGWNVLGAVTGRLIDFDEDEFHDLGFVVQGGVFLTEKAELFARYARFFPDDDRSGGADEFAAITAGLNYYFVAKSHAAKLTGEVTYFPDSQADSASVVRAPDSGAGLAPDEDGGQLGFGVQMQLLF